MFLRQSTASQEIKLGTFLDSTDGNTAETGLTIANTDIILTKHGATTETAKNSGGATHIAGGRYYAVLDATDTNTLGSLEVDVHVAGALAVHRTYTVLPAVVFDAIVLGTDNLDVSVVQWLGTAVKTPATAGVPYTQLNNVTHTGAVIPTVTTLTGHTAQTGDTYALANGAAGFVAIDTVVDAIKAVTDDWIDGARLDLILDIIAADTTTDIPALIATAQADLDTITGADGAALASTQQSITFQPITITAGDAIANITFAGTGSQNGLRWTRSGSGDPFDANFIGQINATVDTALTDYDAATGTELAAVDGKIDAQDAIITETRLAELDAANLPAVIDAILAMLDDPRGEPAQGAPAVNADMATKLDYLYKAWRNKTEQTATTLSVYNDAGTVVDHKSTVSDDGTTATKAEIVTGP